MSKIPIDDTVVYALARLVDDAQSERRDPSHSDIEFQIKRAKLEGADPNKLGPPVGKSKRVRIILNWAMEHSPQQAEVFATGLIATVRSCGGFRESSPNFVGADSVRNLSDAIKPLGVVLGQDGSVSPVALESLSGKRLTSALRGYVERAKKGIEDGALVVGTSKDLMEAVAAHVIQEVWGQYPTTANFPALLGQAFVALDMATPEQKPQQGDHPRARLQRGMYETACAVNNLRNKQGTGHGRPWLPDLEEGEISAAIEFIGTLSALLLDNLEKKKA
ncbi:MAG: abortive infection family protein [Candidatus Eisenbacteria sp.]|nr:abortive infection family protein [Candidatus Eisenbacteria bacterium]